MAATPDKPAGLYVHIPFCLQKCRYCDFYSISDLSQTSRFMVALKHEMKMYCRTPLAFDTLYIGGGTPSVLEPEAIGELIETARKYFNITSDAEITMEINPGRAGFENLLDYRKMGVNRLNIGVQSFDNNNLRFLSRIHSARDARLSVEWARRAGFDNIGLDLIFGLPRQDKMNWLHDLIQAGDFEPEHLSCYMLTCETGTPLSRDMKTGRIRWAAEGMVLDLFKTAIDFLTERSFLHYEISNFARIGGSHREPRTSNHNLKYWTFAPYIGLGPSAHSFIEPVRYWNHRSLATYLRQIEDGKSAIAEKESLTKTQTMIEAIFLGFRTIWGINLAEFQAKFGINFTHTFSKPIAELEKQGMIEINEGHCVLTRKGLLFTDSIASMFISHDLS
ncbi:MAG: radical SAM family heme chaperone HemW [Desulfobacterales bacterium]|jgi:oxygen-independent coproporphyrinogen-3 oxidase